MRSAGARERGDIWESISGKRFDRPALAELIDHARPGDRLCIIRLDRLGRSLRELLETVDDLKARGIHLLSLEEHSDASSPTARPPRPQRSCPSPMLRPGSPSRPKRQPSGPARSLNPVTRPPRPRRSRPSPMPRPGNPSRSKRQPSGRASHPSTVGSPAAWTAASGAPFSRASWWPNSPTATGCLELRSRSPTARVIPGPQPLWRSSAEATPTSWLPMPAGRAIERQTRMRGGEQRLRGFVGQDPGGGRSRGGGGGRERPAPPTGALVMGISAAMPLGGVVRLGHLPTGPGGRSLTRRRRRLRTSSPGGHDA